MVKKKEVMLLIGIVLLAGGVFAGFNYESNDIVTDYSTEDKIRGTFNISLNDEKDSLLTSNFQGEIGLIDFLDANGLIRGDDYTCSTADCENDFSLGNSVSNVNVDVNDDKFLGFGVSGEDVRITDVNFTVSSNVVRSCTNQFNIDVLGDGDNLIFNTKNDPNNISCDVRYESGCFDESESSEVEILSDREYCEKISLPRAPAFIVGAKVRDVPGGSDVKLNMALYDSVMGGKLGECELPGHGNAYEELECVVGYANLEPNDYFVCISSESNAGYKIARETVEPRCGTVYTSSFNNLNNDFEVFAEAVNFAGSPGIVIDDDYYDSNFFIDLTDELDQYLVTKYGRDCQNSECVFPIKFSGINQEFQISNVVIDYEENNVPGSLNELYELSVQETEVSSEELELDLEGAGFIVDSGDDKFELYLDGDLVFEEDIEIEESFDFEVLPRIVTFGQDVLYEAVSGENITNSTWDFGDGISIVVQGNKVNYAYTGLEETSYEMNVTVSNVNGETSTKQFLIYVGEPNVLANDTIKLYQQRILNLTDRLDNSSLWHKTKLGELLDLDNTKATLNTIAEDYNNSVSEEDYKNVMLDLIDLNVPYDVSNKMEGEGVPISVGFQSFNANFIERISNKEVSDNSALKNSFVGWMNQHYNAEIDYQHVAAFYDFDREVLLSNFKIETKPKESVGEDAYLIFGQNVESAGKFKGNNNIKRISGLEINYVELGSGNEVYEFYLEGEVEVENLGAYISPGVKALPVGVKIVGECNLDGICSESEDASTCPEDCSSRIWKFTIWGWVILIFVTFVIYIILQEWYKRNYQIKLFKNGNELYNLLNFIYNARKNGLSDGDIRKKLGASGWKSEKIGFAFRKIDGKRTGMFEIPVLKFLENRKVKKEIGRRQRRPVDRRFVRRRF